MRSLHVNLIRSIVSFSRVGPTSTPVSFTLPTLQGIEPDPSVAPGFVPARALFAFFPTYRASPLPSAFDRVLHAGDASGVQVHRWGKRRRRNRQKERERRGGEKEEEELMRK
jgi:hypothetical protein